MATDPVLRPDPNDVARLVASLVESTWPTSEPERVQWFRHHDIDVDDADRKWGENGSDSFAGVGPQRWGSPHCGWHMFEGEFVGLNWFLWHGAGPAAVREAAASLRARFCELAGEPADEWTPADDPDKFTAIWERQGRTIDMYLHGGPVLSGEHVQDSVVQLHVGHTARERRADEAAREGGSAARS